MTAINQDFDTYIEDNDQIIFTVKDGNGVVIDLSAAAEITWWLYDKFGTIKIIKTKTAGGAVTGTSLGVATVTLAPSDKTNLAGWYFHVAEVTDGNGNISTFECGRGLMKIRSLGD